jgi:hypothetical protein
MKEAVVMTARLVQKMGRRFMGMAFGFQKTFAFCQKYYKILTENCKG